MGIEITTRPRSRRWQRIAGRLALLTVLLALVLMVPAALGLSQHVVSDDAMGGRLARGSLAFEREVRTADQLRPGDVLTFVPPDAATAVPVTRRVVSVDGSTVVTRGDARVADDRWVLDIDRTESWRLVVAMPYLGYPQLVAGWLTPGALVALLATVALGAGLAARRETAPGRTGVRPGAAAGAAPA